MISNASDVISLFTLVCQSYQNMQSSFEVSEHEDSDGNKYTNSEISNMILHRLLTNTHCYETDLELGVFAMECIDEKLLVDEDAIIDEEYRPIDDHTFISVQYPAENNEIGVRAFFISRHDGEGNDYEVFQVDNHQVQDYQFYTICTITIGGENKLELSEEQLAYKYDIIFLLQGLLTLMSVIKNPRFVSRAPAGSRQQRRFFNRGFGKAVDSWHQVTWSVHKPVVAKEPYDSTFHKMPLHYCRGHWRRSEKNHPKSRQRPKAIDAIHRDQWWTWIEGHWRGHPAFGFKKQYHRPRL